MINKLYDTNKQKVTKYNIKITINKRVLNNIIYSIAILQGGIVYGKGRIWRHNIY